LAAQITELKAAKCEKIFQEKVSGARADRKQLARLMALLTKDDTLIVTALDRLAIHARSVRAANKPPMPRRQNNANQSSR
jgi:DNA invertase Pin-like site-specific DNA recombinase